MSNNPFDLTQYDLNIYEARLNILRIQEPDDEYIARMREFAEKNERIYNPPSRVWQIEWEMTDERGWTRNRTIPVPEPKDGKPLTLRTGLFKAHLEAFATAGTPIAVTVNKNEPPGAVFDRANVEMAKLVGNVYLVQEQDMSFFEGGGVSRQVVLPLQLATPSAGSTNGNGHDASVDYDLVKEVALDLLDGVEGVKTPRFLRQLATEFESRGEKYDDHAVDHALVQLEKDGLIKVDTDSGMVVALPL